jgi:predicted amidohydrolase YtcJ
MDPQRPEADVVVVNEGRIAYVGDEAGARAHARSQAEMIDLKGRIALPGFVECHTHPTSAGRWLSQVEVNCTDMRSLEEMIDALRTRAAATPPGEWILGYNYDETRMAERRHPTRHDLDRVSLEHPILLRHFQCR